MSVNAIRHSLGLTVRSRSVLVTPTPACMEEPASRITWTTTVNAGASTQDKGTTLSMYCTSEILTIKSVSGTELPYAQISLYDHRCQIGPYCKENPCQNGGQCIDSLDGPICECESGFKGERSVVIINLLNICRTFLKNV